MKHFHSNKLAIAVFALPALLLYSVLVAYPIFQTVFRSFFEWDGLSSPSYVGIENYLRLAEDPDFAVGLKNGLWFALVNLIYQIVVASALAFMIANKRLKYRKFFKSAFFIPVVLSTTVVCQLWLSIYNGQYGLLNQLFERLGITYQQDWLSDGNTAIFAVAIVSAWQFTGSIMILLYTAIKNIPEEFYDAAAIDGATGFAAHRRVTIPLLAETYKFVIILAVTGGFKAFGEMYIMTGGGPGTSTYTLTFVMFKAAFRLNEFGYACASSVVLVAQCLLFTVLINRMMGRERVSY